MRPINNANPNSSSVVCPMIHAPTTSIDSTGITDENVVMIDRMSTWFIETLMTSSYGGFSDRKRASFSRIRSNTTIVSYSEYPRIVRNAITVDGVTRNWKIE